MVVQERSAVLLETSTELEGLFSKPKYPENLFKYILLVLAILFFIFRYFPRQDLSAVCIFHFR